MLVDLDLDVFMADDHYPLLAFWEMVAEGRHDWHPPLPVALKADEFVGQLGPIKVPAVLEMLAKTLEEAANPGPAEDAGVVVTAANLRVLVRDLGRAAVLVVEDGQSERCFLLAVAGAFDRSHIVRAEQEGWLRIAHAGGKNRMDQFVRTERGHFHLLVRVAALLDSDRAALGQASSNEEMVARIRDVDGVTEVHLWAWREMENYLPCRVWEEHYPHQDARIKSIRDMVPHQRGFLDLKTELGRGGRPIIPDHLTLCEEDFSELGPDAVAELRALLAMIERIL